MRSLSNSIQWFRLPVLVILLAGMLAVLPGSAQEVLGQDRKADGGKDGGKVPEAKDAAKAPDKAEKAKAGSPQQFTPVELLIEGAIYAYGGRQNIKTARGSVEEDGTVRLATDQGDINGTYQYRSIRKDKSWEDLVRTDLDLTPPEAAQQSGAPQSLKYSIAFNGASIWSAQNGQYLNTQPQAEAAFKAQMVHDYLTLLRYREDGSTLELVGPETVSGIETKVVDLATANGDKTRYWISAKSYRVLHLEYELKLPGQEKAVKYRVSYTYSPPRVASNTLAPTKRTMTQDGKFVQEVVVNSIVPAAKIDAEVFQHLQE